MLKANTMEEKDNQELSDFIKETFLELKDYFNLQIRYNKLITAKKTGEISSFLTIFMIMGFLAAFFFLIASFAFAWWYARNDPSQTWVGYLIVMGFYFLLGVLVYIFREKIIFKPLKRYTSHIFFDDDERVFKEEIKKRDDESGDVDVIVKETVLDLSDPETYKIAKEIEETKIRFKEKMIQSKMEEAKEKLDFFSLTKMAVNSIKEHYFTATMATKLAFRALKHLKPKRRKKMKELEQKKPGK